MPGGRTCPIGCTCGRHKARTEAQIAQTLKVGHANKGKPKSEEHRAKMVLNLKPSAPCPPGCDCPRHSDESRERGRAVARTNIGRKRRPEETPGRKCEEGCTCSRHEPKPCPDGCTCGRHDEENRRRLVERLTGRVASPETRAKMVAAGRSRWAATTPERKAEIIKKVSDGRLRGNGPSGFELAIRDVLDLMDVRWVPDLKVSGFFPDLYLPDYHALLEANGCYWHACTSCFPAHKESDRMHKRDRMKAGVYRKAGYALTVIIEHEFTRDPEGTVQRALEEVIQGS